MSVEKKTLPSVFDTIRKFNNASKELSPSSSSSSASSATSPTSSTSSTKLRKWALMSNDRKTQLQENLASAQEREKNLKSPPSAGSNAVQAARSRFDDLSAEGSFLSRSLGSPSSFMQDTNSSSSSSSNSSLMLESDYGASMTAASSRPSPLSMSISNEAPVIMMTEASPRPQASEAIPIRKQTSSSSVDSASSAEPAPKQRRWMNSRVTATDIHAQLEAQLNQKLTVVSSKQPEYDLFTVEVLEAKGLNLKAKGDPYVFVLSKSKKKKNVTYFSLFLQCGFD